MITFTDITITNTTHLSFVPEALKADICHHLKAAHVPYKSIPWRSLTNNPQDPYDTIKVYKQALDGARTAFEQAGYLDTTCMGAIETPIHPTDFFQKCKLFFKPTMDADHRAECQAYDRSAQEHYKEYYQNFPEGYLPISEE